MISELKVGTWMTPSEKYVLFITYKYIFLFSVHKMYMLPLTSCILNVFIL